MRKPDFSKKSIELDAESRKEAEVLLKNKASILRRLAEAGLREESPYIYLVPDSLAFECGHGADAPMRSLWAVVVIARASNAAAYWLDCDDEGYPELPQFCYCPVGFHRVFISDPFAFELDRAIGEWQMELVRAGKARIVNGRFFKVA